MPSYSFSRMERGYLAVQPSFGVIPNGSGTASLAGSDACRFIKMGLENQVALLTRPDKTGTRSAQGMVGGRRISTWNVEQSLVANGTQGQLPDADPILQGLFGATASVDTGSASITSSTDATPIVLTTAAHGLATSQVHIVSISSHLTNTNANGTYAAYATDATSLTLLGSTATGAGVGSGGSVSKVIVKYTLSDDITFFTLWSFRQPSSVDHRVAHTCIVNQATFNLGQDVATWTASGDTMWVLSSKSFGSADAYQRAGLTAFPAEPATPVTNGNIIPGFTGRFVMGPTATIGTNAKAFPSVRNLTVTARTENAHIKDTFGSYYATSTEGGERNIAATFNVYDDDSDEVQALKLAADAKTPQNAYITVGTEAGNTFTFILRNIYLASNTLGDGQLRFDVSFGESRATSSSLALKDEFELVIV